MRLHKKNLFVCTVLMLAAAAVVFAGGQQDRAPADGGKTRLVFWAYESMVGEDKALENAIEAFETANPDIEVDMVPTQYGSSSFRDKYITSVQAGGGPDVLMGDIVWGPELAAMEAILPIDDLAAKGDLDSYYPGPVDTLRYKGKVYGLPFYTNAVAMYINKTAFRNAGLDIPGSDWENTWSWEEFEHAMDTLTADGMYGYGLLAGWGGTFEFFPFLWSNGGKVLNEDYTEFAMDNKAGVEASRFFLGLIEKGYTPEAAKTWKKWDELHAAFANEVIAAYVCGDWGLKAVENMEPDFEWGLVPIPVAKQPASLVGGANIMINKTSKNPEAAYRFISYMTGDEVVYKLMDSRNRLAARRGNMDKQQIVRDDPKMSVIVSALEYAKARPPIPNWTTIDWNVLQPAFMTVYLEDTPLEKALAEARAKTEEILAE